MIKKITIENFKSIEKVQFDFNSPKQEIVCLVGKNGVGKSNIFKALQYFFNYLEKPYSDEQIIDSSNPYIQSCAISIVFDLSLLYKKSKGNSELYSRFNKIIDYCDKKLENDKLSFYSLFDEILQIELKLIQYRDGEIKWNIKDRSIRSTIKSVFPFYYFDTRTLDLYTWDKLWKIISDLSATVPHKNQTECAELLDNAFNEIYGEKYTKSSKIIEDAFKSNHVKFDSYRFESRFKSALAVRFGGDKFSLKNHTLDYFSDGTNSFNYLILLTTLIPKISDVSCKYPVVIIDEPEIGLHSEYISRFVKSVFENVNNNAFMMFSTHSPLLICDLTNIKADYSLYKVSLHRQHTIINKMNTAWLAEANHRVSVRETECFFADYLVYVEGETEIQLFHDRHLVGLFPWLDRIHFYSFDSNHERLETVNSQKLNLGTRYRLLVDIDKIIKYNKSTQTFYFNHNDINPLYKPSPTYDFYKNETKTKSSLIDDINTNIAQTYCSNGKHYIDNIGFNTLISDIQKYCQMYNIIVNWTTIEGELITYENTTEFINYMRENKIEKNTTQHTQILQVLDPKEKSCLILCEFDGRTEDFTSKNELLFAGRTIEIISGKKTSGWINEWLEYYFTNNIDTIEDDNAKLSVFSRDFPGLINTLQSLKKMIDYNCE